MEYRVFRLFCSEEYREIFIAELAELGFDMMQETETGLEAFSENQELNNSITDDLLKKYSTLGISAGNASPVFSVSFSVSAA